MIRRTFYISVCDDDASDRKQIGKMARDICRLEKIQAEITCYKAARALLHDLRNEKSVICFCLM